MAETARAGAGSAARHSAMASRTDCRQALGSKARASSGASGSWRYVQGREAERTIRRSESISWQRMELLPASRTRIRSSVML